jgi:hypothetical protein
MATVCSVSPLLPALHYYCLEMVAAFIPGSFVEFMVLHRWNGVSKLIFQQEKTKSPKQKFNNS